MDELDLTDRDRTFHPMGREHTHIFHFSEISPRLVLGHKTQQMRDRDRDIHTHTHIDRDSVLFNCDALNLKPTRRETAETISL